MPPSAPSQTGFARQALLPDGWHRNVLIRCDAQGRFDRIIPDADPASADWHADIAIPPLPSLHSHAFQRAMAGLAETRQNPADSFWTWRERMYALATTITPDTMQAIAAYLYMEMLKAGYTQVAEFHYLHRAPNGRAYDRPAEMALNVVAGARTAGIGITMLPTLYCQAGFGKPLAPAQARFASDPEFIARLIDDVLDENRASSLVTCGIGLHSLRAVSDSDLHAMLRLAPSGLPIHIHIAEQQREVDDCVAFLGRRPVTYLLDEYPVDQHWCLVHATHLDDSECTRLARSGAVAGLCPITEGNLGDGLFPLSAYLDAGGRFGIGSDSNILLSPGEELRLLEYGQRLAAQKRCVGLPTDSTGSVGAFLYTQALDGGAQACGHPGAGLSVGQRADLCTIRSTDLSLPDLKGHAILDSAIFARPALPIHDVMCAGNWQVRAGHHIAEDAITAAFRRATTTTKS